MHKSILLEKIGRITRQRNLFLGGMVLMCLSNLLLGFKIAIQETTTVLVPALRQEMIISSSGVSKSYIEEMTLLFLSNLLDLSPSDIEHKKDLILKYTSNSNKEAARKLVDYFLKCEMDYKRFDLTTYFSVKNLEIDMEHLIVIARGILTSYYGKSGYESEQETYKLEFDFQGGMLRLKSFVRIVDEERAAKDKARSLKLEESVSNVEEYSAKKQDVSVQSADEANNTSNDDYETQGEPQ